MVSRFKPSTLQLPPDSELLASSRQVYAAALADAEREFQAAQAGLQQDDSDAARARYATALARYDTLQGMFPMVAAGLGDVQA